MHYCYYSFHKTYILIIAIERHLNNIVESYNVFRIKKKKEKKIIEKVSYWQFSRNKMFWKKEKVNEKSTKNLKEYIFSL